jgi:cytochrome c biogenesis protein
MLAEAHKRPGRDPIEVIWTLFCSLRFAVVLNIALALVAMVGTVIPQMPLGIQDFEREFAQWMQQAQGRYGDLAGLMYWAGLFDLYNSLPFRLLVMLVIFGIIICTLNRWQPIMRLITRPTISPGESFITGLAESASFRNVPVSVGQAEEAVRNSLRKSRYRVLQEVSPDGTVNLYGDRDRWSKLVTFVSHAALVLLILAAAGIAQLGWREQSVYFNPGEPVKVGHGTNFEVRNDGFSIEYYPNSTTVKEYRNTLAVIEGGKEVLTKTIIVNDPLNYKGINFFLVSYQPIAYVRVLDGNGQPVALNRMGASGPVVGSEASGEALVEFAFIGEDNLPLDFLQMHSGEQVVTLEMKYYQDVQRADGENPPIYIRAYVDKDFEKPVYDGFLPRTGKLVLPGYEQYDFSFRKDTATVLEIAKDPGLGYVGFFFVIMAAGFTISLYTTLARCWARIVPNAIPSGTVNILVGGLAEKNKVSFERDFERLAERIKAALEGRAVKPQDEV